MAMAMASLIGVSPFQVAKAQPASADRGIDVVDVVTATGTVEKLDLAKRRVTLLMDDGHKKTVKADKSVKNLDQVKVGDKLKLDYAEETVILVGKSNGDPAAASAGMAKIAPKGAMPGAAVVETSVITAKVLSVDVQKNRITVEEPNGKKKTIKLGKKIGVGQLKVGETIEMSITEALAIQVVKA